MRIGRNIIAEQLSTLSTYIGCVVHSCHCGKL